MIGDTVINIQTCKIRPLFYSISIGIQGPLNNTIKMTKAYSYNRMKSSTTGCQDELNVRQ